MLPQTHSVTIYKQGYEIHIPRTADGYGLQMTFPNGSVWVMDGTYHFLQNSLELADLIIEAEEE